MEIEIKLGPVDPALASRIFDDTALLPPAGPEERIQMRTVYYDDPAGGFSSRRQTLRLRQENDLSVCTFKTALTGLARVELECHAPDIVTGAALLARLPEMPADALEGLQGGVFVPKCGARFVRRTRLCRVEGAAFHLCLDEGMLEKGAHRADLCEIELELAEGDPVMLQAVAALLIKTYGLTVCTHSKQQRALALGEVQP